MNIRLTTTPDCAAVLALYTDAQQTLAQQHINQWQDGYPNEASLKEDIQQKTSYVVVKDQQIVGTFACSCAAEPTYQKITDGKWLTQGEYVVIHRLAISTMMKRQGVAQLCLRYCAQIAQQQGINSLRIDTHQDNVAMQQLLQSQGFQYCGSIYLVDGAPRLAYEKLLCIQHD